MFRLTTNLPLSAQVSWYKDSNLLSQSESVRFQTEANRHTLILRLRSHLTTVSSLTSIPLFFSSIHTGFDFGNYSCVAENSIGTFKYVNGKIHKIYIKLFFFYEIRKHIEVHGRPTIPIFRSKPNTHQDRVSLLLPALQN